MLKIGLPELETQAVSNKIKKTKSPAKQQPVIIGLRYEFIGFFSLKLMLMIFNIMLALFGRFCSRIKELVRLDSGRGIFPCPLFPATAHHRRSNFPVSIPFQGNR
jgi:hypothetical protein